MEELCVPSFSSSETSIDTTGQSTELTDETVEPDEPAAAGLQYREYYDLANRENQALIERFGGPSGVRDLGLLESALFRPRTGYYRDLAQMAAALFESLIMNHPFIDGNKRVAFFAADVFR